MSSLTSDSEYGRRAERAAAWMLRLHGFRILGRNVRIGGREVDVLARRGRLLVVCEVKARRHDGAGGPLEAVDRHKRRRMREAAELLLEREAWAEVVRFDVIAVDGLRLRHLPDAF